MQRPFETKHTPKGLPSSVITTPTVRHDRVDKLRGQNAPCSPDEWERMLTFLLLGRGSFDNVDATATVQEESTVTITIRKRVQNITVGFRSS